MKRTLAFLGTLAIGVAGLLLAIFPHVAFGFGVGFAQIALGAEAQAHRQLEELCFGGGTREQSQQACTDLIVTGGDQSVRRQILYRSWLARSMLQTDPAASANHYLQVVELDPQNLDARNNASIGFIWGGELERAAELNAYVVRHRPNDLFARYVRAILAIERGDLAVARSEVDYVLSHLHEADAELNARRRDRDASSHVFVDEEYSYVQDMPRRAYLIRAILLQHAGNAPAALSDLNESMRRQGDRDYGRMLAIGALCDHYKNSGAINFARRACETALALAPSAEAQLALARLSLRERDYTAAEAQYSRILETVREVDLTTRSPERLAANIYRGEAYYGRSIARRELGREDEAIRDRMRALDVSETIGNLFLAL